LVYLNQLLNNTVTQIIIKARQPKGQDNALLARQKGKTSKTLK